MKVFILHHVRREGDEEDVKLIGVYSSRETAREAIIPLISKPGFRRFPEGFEIDEYTVDKTCWSSGFGFEDDESQPRFSPL